MFDDAGDDWDGTSVIFGSAIRESPWKRFDRPQRLSSLKWRQTASPRLLKTGACLPEGSSLTDPITCVRVTLWSIQVILLDATMSQIAKPSRNRAPKELETSLTQIGLDNETRARTSTVEQIAGLEHRTGNCGKRV